MCVMAESSFCSEVTDNDMETLKEALRAQQQLLQKLYFELDEEREASSSATSEAMSMILRLQGEKAQMKMEASQYKRVAEEKLCLAEESLAIFEDLMYQKEMEIACLEFQVQAYRCKLLGTGCSDLSIPEYRFPENPQQQRNEPVITEIGVQRNAKRHDSLSSLYLKEYFPKKSTIERERSAIPMLDVIPKIEVTNATQEVNVLTLDLEKKVGISGGGDLNLYWERIRKLDGHVKEISDGKFPRRVYSTNSKSMQFRSCSLPPLDSEETRLSCSPPSDGISASVDQIKCVTASVGKNEAPNAFSVSSVQDKFEVLQNNEDCKAYGQNETEQKKLISEGDKRYKKTVAEEKFEFQVKDKTEFRNKVPLCPRYKDKSSMQRERTITDCQFSLPSTSIITSDIFDIQSLMKRVERLETKENITRQEIKVDEEPSLTMLKEILDQINALQFDLRNYKAKKTFQLDYPRLDSVSEAMLHFWL